MTLQLSTLSVISCTTIHVAEITTTLVKNNPREYKRKRIDVTCNFVRDLKTFHISALISRIIIYRIVKNRIAL